MIVGENIRRIRQERGLTQRQLGDMVGASEAYIRAYESGRRNPKPASLEKIANALSVNPEVLANSDFDGLKAMHRLFQIFRQYDGHLFEYQDNEGNDMVGISFGTLTLMRSWLDRYEEFLQEVEKCNEIKDVKKRGEALLKAESDFNLWMDIYPESEPFSMNLQIQKSHDDFVNKIGLNPKNGKKNGTHYGRNLYWIPDINLATYGSLDECIGKDMLEFLKNMVASAEGSTVYPIERMQSINMHPEGKCVGYMDIILSRKRKLRFAEETEEIKYEIDVCKNFSRICKSIN